MAQEKERCHVRASGRVQGVGFRYFVSHNAARFDLTGWVRNLEDGDVEMEIQGSHAGVQALIEVIQEGNRWILVENLQITPCPVIEEREFRTRM